jgi:hypothetical protein
MTLSRARRLSSERISRHGACFVSVASNIPNRPKCPQSPQEMVIAMSPGTPPGYSITW